MNEEAERKTGGCRPWWRNCCGPDDDSLLSDEEVAAIDRMEESIGAQDLQTSSIRELITVFEACYHEADKEAERIVEAIGSGRCPEGTNERPPQRKRELQNTRDILSAWCKNPKVRWMELDVGGVPTEELLGFIGEASPLCERLRIVSDTLRCYWKGEEAGKTADTHLLTLLGESTPVKRWLAASLDKTIRLQLEAPSDFWLDFS